jgi:hypothetical protein
VVGPAIFHHDAHKHDGLQTWTTHRRVKECGGIRVQDLDPGLRVQVTILCVEIVVIVSHNIGVLQPLESSRLGLG